MIVSLEGAPATGKTTTAHHLVEKHGAVRIAEVNELHPRRPSPEPRDWYWQRQLDRWRDAVGRRDRLVVLDGDVLQAVWYTWARPEHGFPHWSEALDFFESQEPGAGLPDLHVHLQIDVEERRRRERGREHARGHDRERAEAKVQRHEGLRSPLRSVFTALGEAFPCWVLHLTADDLERNAEVIVKQEPARPDGRAVLSFLRSWLDEHDPASHADP
ncbi:MAG: AAA family ATPase [Acidobacteriota bacterium]